MRIDCEHLSLTANRCPCPVNCQCQPCALKKVKCGMCQYEGGADTYLPNYTSLYNACRCPECGSTKNPFNAEHSKWWNEQEKERKAKEKERHRELESLCSEYGRECTSKTYSVDHCHKLEHRIFETAMRMVMGEGIFDRLRLFDEQRDRT